MAVEGLDVDVSVGGRPDLREAIFDLGLDLEGAIVGILDPFSSAPGVAWGYRVIVPNKDRVVDLIKMSMYGVG